MRTSAVVCNANFVSSENLLIKIDEYFTQEIRLNTYVTICI